MSDPNRRLVLMAGMHKTGTTSIQNTCAANLDALRQAGFLYPRYGFRLRDGSRHFDDNQSSLMGNMFYAQRRWKVQGDTAGDEAFARDKAGLRAGLQRNLANTAGGVLVVAEEISRMRREELQDIKDFFEGLGFAIDFHVFIRKPASWATSMTAQFIAGGRSVRWTIEQSIASFTGGNMGLADCTQRMREVFPQARFHAFTDAVAHPQGPVGYLFDAAGIAVGPDIRIVKANESGSDAGIRLHAALNARVGGRLASKDHQAFYARLPQTCPWLFDVPGPKFALRASEAAPMLDDLARENAYFERMFGAGYYDETIAFTDAPPLVDDAARAHLMPHLDEGPQPVREVVRGFLGIA
jgi:hypothetical protein